jgi:hypothetical protein
MNSLQNRYTGSVRVSTSKLELRFGAPLETHTSNFLQVTVDISLQHLDRDLPSLILALPHVPKPTATQRDPCWVVR